MLQCVERGQIGLDDPLTAVLPELKDKDILESISTDTNTLQMRPSTVPITARHLITHTSGLGYWFTHPLLMQWRSSTSGAQTKDSQILTKRFDYPLMFDPGEGWLYGSGLDWAGVAISRLNNNMGLEAYMVANMWKPLGLQAPFPSFHVEKEPDYAARLMGTAVRTPDGALKEDSGLAFCAHLDDDEGGQGLAMTMGDFVAVLGDLVADKPKLLKPETVNLMFEPQLASGSKGIEGLVQLRPAWDMVAGPVQNEDVNHGLGGLLVLKECGEIGQPKNVLCWGGSPNIVWWVCREHGVAGVLGTQLMPFGDGKVKEVVNAWKKDFWESRKAYED